MYIPYLSSLAPGSDRDLRRFVKAWVVSAVYDYDCAPYLCPKHCGPFTAAKVALDLLIYQSHIPLSLYSPMMRRTYHTIMAVLARLDRVRH